jgi:hypothetical protein
MPSTAPNGPGALVRQAEELGDVLHVMRGQLLFIPHTLPECNDSRSIGDTRDGVANLEEPLDEGV